MLDWQQTSKGKSLGVDAFTEEVAPGLQDRLPDLGACENSLKATDYLSLLNKIRIENINNVIVGNLNINSLPRKFDDLKVLVTGMVDILIITEATLDNTFPVCQLHIDGYSKLYKLDRNRDGDGIILYVRKDTPNIMLTKYNFPDNIEGLFIELNLRKSK